MSGPELRQGRLRVAHVEGFHKTNTLGKMEHEEPAYKLSDSLRTTWLGDTQMPEQEIRRILSQDLSAGTEAFRDALLARCLEVLGSDDSESGLDLFDEDLELLAAAGSPDGLHRDASDGTGGVSQ